MSTAVTALPNILDPMFWIGPQGLFAAAVLPTILVIVFVETGLLFPLLPGESLLFTGGLLAAHGTLNIWVLAPPSRSSRYWATRPGISSAAGSGRRCSRRKTPASSRSTM